MFSLLDGYARVTAGANAFEANQQSQGGITCRCQYKYKRCGRAGKTRVQL